MDQHGGRERICQADVCDRTREQHFDVQGIIAPGILTFATLSEIRIAQCVEYQMFILPLFVWEGGIGLIPILIP